MPTEPTLEQAARRAIELVSRCRLLGPDEHDARAALDTLYAALSRHAETMGAVRELGRAAQAMITESDIFWSALGRRMPAREGSTLCGLKSTLARLRDLGVIE